MEQLPNEILCTIFLSLDKKSRKNATATCQHWFDLIRNSNSSNHIGYKGTIEELQQRIENLEWDWKRWPALKQFEILGSSRKEDLLNDLSIDFKQCPSLELVIFDVRIDIADLFPIPNCSLNCSAEIRKFSFNPHCEVTQFGLDHIFSLRILRQNDEVFKIINENLKGLKELWVDNLSDLDNLVCKSALLELHITGHNASSELKIAGLKKLKTLTVRKLAHLDNLVGMDALLELCIMDESSSELKIAGLKKLKTLKVYKLAQLDNLVGMDESLLELSVRDVKCHNDWNRAGFVGVARASRMASYEFGQNDWNVVKGNELEEYDLSNITKRFKNLQECDIAVDYYDYVIQPDKYAQTVQDVFQNSATRVEICFKEEATSSTTYLTKEPFQRCVMKKKKVSKLAQLEEVWPLGNLVGMDESLLELRVQDVSLHEFKEYDLSNIAKHYKNLQKCDIDVDCYGEDLIQPEDYVQFVQDVFQNSATRVKIVFNNWSSTTSLTKEPFQRCVMKKTMDKLPQLDDLVSMDALLELIVTHVDGHELKDYDLSNIVKLFKNLQKCDIRVIDPNDIIQPEEYAQIVQDVFENFATRVSIIIDKRKMMGCRGINLSDNSHISRCPTYYLTKEPFQRCVVKKK